MSNLTKRWTPEQIEHACSIVNDIAEDIDNSEGRKELRQALAIYADMLTDSQNMRSSVDSARICKSVSALMKELGKRGRGKSKRIGARASWTPEARRKREANLSKRRNARKH